jgi:alanine racemase
VAEEAVIFSPAPSDAALAGATLSVDLKALQDNWRTLAAQAGSCECAATVKGDAYGLGIEPVARALWSVGCKTYFVALPCEGATMRAVLPDAAVYILDGLLAGCTPFYLEHNLRPVLSSLDEIAEWRETGKPAGLHVDTGMNRLGLSASDVEGLLQDGDALSHLNLSLVMTHLTCGEVPGHDNNRTQLDRFNALRARLPDAPASIANSPGSFLGQDFALDVIRPGIALFGGNPFADRPNPMHAVAHLYAPILQVRHLQPGECVGYRQTWCAEREARIAVLGVGYRDGYPRALSYPARNGPAQVMIGGQFCPVVGRVSMDMITVDITDIGDEFARRGVRAEIMGDNITVDELAGWAGTISYEILTSLGTRYARLYSGFNSV